MANCETVCLFPVYCRACRVLLCANLFDSPITCEKCGGSDVVAYDAPELLGEAGASKVFSWHIAERLGRIPRLSDGSYLCPSCQQKRLLFKDVGNWD
jgi:hypothetical protein